MGDSKVRRFWHRVWLNAKGMKLFGDVFSDRMVPVVSMIPGTAFFGVRRRRCIWFFMRR